MYIPVIYRYVFKRTTYVCGFYSARIVCKRNNKLYLFELSFIRNFSQLYSCNKYYNDSPSHSVISYD